MKPFCLITDFFFFTRKIFFFVSEDFFFFKVSFQMVQGRYFPRFNHSPEAHCNCLIIIFDLQCADWKCLHGFGVARRVKKKSTKDPCDTVIECHMSVHLLDRASRNRPHHCSHMLQSCEHSGNRHHLIFHFSLFYAPGFTSWQAAQPSSFFHIYPSTEHHNLRCLHPDFSPGT